MPPTKLVRRPLLSAFAFPEVGLMRNRLRNILDDPTLRFFEEPVNEEMLPEAIGWYPAVDVTESPEEYTFVAELPGPKKEEVNISWDHDVLTIKGEKTREVKKENEEKKFHLYERSYGSFLRTFTLPEKVVAEKIAAEMELGVLKVHVPKAPEVKAAAKKIEIKAK